VLLTHAREPASDAICFCDVIARDPFFIVGREPRPDFRFADLAGIRFASVAGVPTPWLCLQDDIRRAGIDPLTLDRISGPSMVENAATLCAGSIDAVQLFQPYAEELIASGAGHVWYAAADRGLTAYTALVTRRPLLETRRDELLGMTRAMTRTLRWMVTTPGNDIARALGDYFPSVPPDILAAAIDRYRALRLFAPDPVLRREGVDRLQAAMRSGGALVDNTLADEAVAATRLAG
jgi:NitT/TauT family transport system substrate-binding protein